jgi:hypothetical protein
MKRVERLESRLPLAAQVLDLNPGFYGSQIEPVRLVDEWLYLEATVGEERRLMKTDGESFADLGPELPFLDRQSFLRGEQLIGVTPTGVAAWDFSTDTLTVLSEEPGGTVLNSETVMWHIDDAVLTYQDANGNERWDITIDYHDIDGRQFHFELTDASYSGQAWFSPVDVSEDALVISGDLILDPESAYYIVRSGEATRGPDDVKSVIDLAGEILFEVGNNYVTETGDVQMAKPARFYDFGTGAWILDNGQILRYSGGVSTLIGTVVEAEWSPAFVTAFFWDSEELVFGGRSELWGQEPYKATQGGIEFMGNYSFGPNDFNTVPLGTYSTYQLMRSGDMAYLYDGDQFIRTALDVANFVHMSDTHVLLKHYTEATGSELLQYDLPPGDANLDGLFDSSDLVHLFQLGEYEDALAGNSSRATGDFDGDNEFDTSDLVLAFQAGTYQTA